MTETLIAVFLAALGGFLVGAMFMTTRTGDRPTVTVRSKPQGIIFYDVNVINGDHIKAINANFVPVQLQAGDQIQSHLLQL